MIGYQRRRPTVRGVLDGAFRTRTPRTLEDVIEKRVPRDPVFEQPMQIGSDHPLGRGSIVLEGPFDGLSETGLSHMDLVPQYLSTSIPEWSNATKLTFNTFDALFLGEPRLDRQEAESLDHVSFARSLDRGVRDPFAEHLIATTESDDRLRELPKPFSELHLL